MDTCEVRRRVVLGDVAGVSQAEMVIERVQDQLATLRVGQDVPLVPDRDLDDCTPVDEHQ